QPRRAPGGAAGAGNPDRHPLPGAGAPAAGPRGPGLSPGGLPAHRAGRSRGALAADVRRAVRGADQRDRAGGAGLRRRGTDLRRGGRSCRRAGAGGVMAAHELDQLPRRLVPLMRAAIARCRLDLSGLTVLTEAASGAYVVTPVLAALAGAARVIAVTRTTRY